MNPTSQVQSSGTQGDEIVRLKGLFSRSSFIKMKPLKQYPNNRWNSKQEELSADEINEMIRQGKDALENVARCYKEGNHYGVCQLVSEVVPTLSIEDIDQVVDLRFRRIICLIILGFESDASDEFDLIGSLDDEYEDFPDLWPDRCGRIINFDFRFIQAIIPLGKKNHCEALNRISKLLLELKLGKYAKEGADSTLKTIMLTCELIRILNVIEEYGLAESIMRLLTRSAGDSIKGILNYNFMKLLVQNKNSQEAINILNECDGKPGFPLSEAKRMVKLLLEGLDSALPPKGITDPKEG